MLKYMNSTLSAVGTTTVVLLLSCAVLVSCIREDTGDCPVPHRFDYDWCNRVEAEEVVWGRTTCVFTTAAVSAIRTIVRRRVRCCT